MLRQYRRQRDNAEAMIAGHGLAAKRREARLQLELSAAHAARRAVLDRAGSIDGELLQSLEEEFDFEEGRLRRALGGHGD